MKKLIIIFFSITFIFLTGCNTGLKKSSASKIAKNQATVILNCLKTGQTEDLKRLFCEEVRNTHDIDKEIQDVIKIINDKIVDDGKWVGMSEGGKSIENGIVTKSDINASLVDVCALNGNKYIISFYHILFIMKMRNI